MKTNLKTLIGIILSRRVAIGACIGALFSNPQNYILWAILAVNLWLIFRDSDEIF